MAAKKAKTAPKKPVKPVKPVKKASPMGAKAPAAKTKPDKKPPAKAVKPSPAKKPAPVAAKPTKPAAPAKASKPVPAAKPVATPTKPAAKSVAAPAKPAPAPTKPVVAEKPAPVQTSRPAPRVSANTLATKVTPVLLVELIEPVLAFWARIGFRATVEVPGTSGLDFVILSNGITEIMYQTWSALRADLPDMAARQAQPDKTYLFIEVTDLDAVIKAMESRYSIFMQRRETFYGSMEIGYREPGGHYVTFAQFKDR